MGALLICIPPPVAKANRFLNSVAVASLAARGSSNQQKKIWGGVSLASLSGVAVASP